MKNALLTSLFILGFGFLNAQDLRVGDINAYPKEMVSVGLDETGDTTANIMFYTCVITAEKSFTSPKEKAKWDKLKRDVKAAYPYSVLAKMKLAEMDSQLVSV